MLPADALRAALVQALPIDDDARLHWAVTIAFCAQAAGDIELASIQRDAYRDFRANVTDLVRVSGRASGRSARPEAERLIALLDGVALQAMFDPESWPARRQLAVLDAELALAR